MNQCEIAGCDAEIVDGETCATHTANYTETDSYEPEICVCGHDDVTHALRLVGGWGKCFASLPNEQGEIGWECKCPKFVPMPSADEIRAAQAEARAAEEDP